MRCTRALEVRPEGLFTSTTPCTGRPLTDFAMGLAALVFRPRLMNQCIDIGATF